MKKIVSVFVLLCLIGCSDRGSVFMTTDGCRFHGNTGVTITQKVEKDSVTCVIEYRRPQ